MGFRSILIGGIFAAASAAASQEKIYLNPEQIHLEPAALFVFVEDSWRMAEGLFVDGQGIYVYQTTYETGWYCNFCLRKHSCQLPCPYTGKEPPRNCK